MDELRRHDGERLRGDLRVRQVHEFQAELLGQRFENVNLAADVFFEQDLVQRPRGFGGLSLLGPAEVGLRELPFRAERLEEHGASFGIARTVRPNDTNQRNGADGSESSPETGPVGRILTAGRYNPAGGEDAHPLHPIS